MTKSIIETLVQGATPEYEQLVRPTLNAGTDGTGSASEGDLRDIISPNAVCKYINIRLQVANEGSTEDAGWYEYAVFIVTEATAVPNVGTRFNDFNIRTVADMAIQNFRGKCLWNGAIPLNDNQAKVLDLNLKIPTKYCKWTAGQYLMLVHGARSANTADVGNVDVIWITQWKCYL